MEGWGIACVVRQGGEWIMKIWAHRGCSQMYPENTITAFSKAIDLNGLTGIELDIQMTRDGEIVVIHDERVDRTTDGIGYVKNHTFAELRKLVIAHKKGNSEQISTIGEVFDLVQDRMKEGMLMNIELKNSIVPYEGMEEKIIGLVNRRNLQKQVVYSSFYTMSLHKIREIDESASIGVLDTKVSDCFYKKAGCFGKDNEQKEQPEERDTLQTALHPFWKGMDFTREQLDGQTVRAWFGGHLYPEKPTGTRLDLEKLEDMGITDVFLNEPEVYL